MKVTWLFAILLSLVYARPVLATEEQEMLWINVQSEREPETTIAISLAVARELSLSGQDHLTMGRKNDAERELQHLLQEVLEGAKEEGEVYDREDNTRIRVWKASTTIPGGKKRDGNTLVVEVREKGERMTTIRLPNITVETTSETEDAVVETSIGWRAFLPFLAEHGGAVYIATDKDETEIWVYIQ